METLRINQVKPGQVFDQSLFLSSGQKLLVAGVQITERHVEALRRSGEMDIHLADNVQELAEAGLINQADGGRLAVGQTSTQRVISRGGQVILEPGQEVEQHHIDALSEGGAFSSQEDESPDKRPADRRERIMMADVLVEDLMSKAANVSMRVTPEAGEHWVNPGDSSTWPAQERLTKLREDTVHRVRKAYARIEAGEEVSIELFNDLLDDLLAKLQRHPARFTQLALLTPRREDYLPDHAYTVTILAMAIGAHLRWPKSAVREVGLAGMLYDLGMLLVPERIRVGACELSDIDRGRVRRHPVFSLSMLQAVKDVPMVVQVTALEHHERENGSGYPTGLRRESISDYARVLAVADTYAAITEPRHYRQSKLPYQAMEETLRAASAQIFWLPAVRSLVQAAGLFPVGSYVKLSSGQTAKVLAANPRDFDRPVVQPVTERGNNQGQPIDLATVDKQTLGVVRAIAAPSG